jgi:hypothetical protein
MACLCRAERKKTLHLAKQKLPDGRGELVKENSLGLLASVACLDLVELQRNSSRFALEFNKIEKSWDLVKTAEVACAVRLKSNATCDSAFSSSYRNRWVLVTCPAL